MEEQIQAIEEVLSISTSNDYSFKEAYNALQEFNGALVPWEQMLSSAIEVAANRKAEGIQLADAAFITREWLIDIGIIK